MPTSQATPLSRCRRCIGLGALLLSLTPGLSLSAAAPNELKRSDVLDMRRAGKVSEDERAVLRIEWRAGMSGVEADRSVQEIMTKLRQMEANVQSIGQTLRSLPAEKRSSPALAPTAASSPDRGEGYDWRLMAANITALILVAIWWSNRRKNQAEAAAVAAQLAARTHAETSAIEATPMPQFNDFAAPEAMPEPPAPPNVFAFEPSLPDVAEQAIAPTRVEPESVAVPEVIPAAAVAESAPAPEQTPVIDFVLEEADPATVAAEKPRAPKNPLPLVTPETVSASLKKNVEPTLQLAEIMLSMGLEQGAAQTLVEYSEAHPKHAIYHMLKLLGIYRKRGLHQEFQETAEKLRKNFNIQAADWALPESSDAPSLEGFSRVSQHVQSIWGQPEECITYLRHLIEDNRDGARAGFPQSVAEEILLLVEILKETSGSAQEVA